MKNTSESSRKQGSRENSTGSQAGWYVELQVLCEFGGNSTQLHVLAPPGNAIHRAATSVRSQDTQIWADFACLCFGLVPGSSPSCSHITNMLCLRHLWKSKIAALLCVSAELVPSSRHSAHPRTSFHVVSMRCTQSWEKVKAGP